MPARSRYAAPSRVAMRSPNDRRRARVLGVTSPTIAAPSTRSRSSLRSAARSSAACPGESPSSRARASWRASISSSSSPCPPESARSATASNWDVTPLSAECTTSGRYPESSRSCSTDAIVAQFAAVETEVPPNFRTIQRGVSLGIGEGGARRGSGRSGSEERAQRGPRQDVGPASLRLVSRPIGRAARARCRRPALDACAEPPRPWPAAGAPAGSALPPRCGAAS